MIKQKGCENILCIGIQIFFKCDFPTSLNLMSVCLLLPPPPAAGMLQPSSSLYRQMCNILQLNILEDVSQNENPIHLFKNVHIQFLSATRYHHSYEVIYVPSVSTILHMYTHLYYTSICS